jgi:hypothetical protein
MPDEVDNEQDPSTDRKDSPWKSPRFTLVNPWHTTLQTQFQKGRASIRGLIVV